MRHDSLVESCRRAAGLLVGLMLAGCGGHTGGHPPVTSSHPTFDLGMIHSGERIVSYAVGRNDGNTALRLARFLTSCDCAVVHAEPAVVPAHMAFTLVTVVDLTAKPRFQGNLAVEVDAFPYNRVAGLPRDLNIAVKPVGSFPFNGDR